MDVRGKSDTYLPILWKISAVKALQTFVGLGEVLWDVFPTGPRFGGAPANFCCSAASLLNDQAEVWMVSAVGDDDLGERAIRSLQENGVGTKYMQVAPQATGRVDIELDDSGIATYEFAEDSAWDHLRWNPDLQRLASRTDAVCFGTLGQRNEGTQQVIRRFLTSVPQAALKVFDINLRPPFFSDEVIEQSLQLCNVLKLNDSELPVLRKQYQLPDSAEQAIRTLADRFDLSCVVYTCGADGAACLRDDRYTTVASEPVEVIDTVGAGDAFTAAFVAGLLANTSTEALLRKASRVAAYVCSQPGATPKGILL